MKRKLKGFNEALKEIKQAAGLEEDIKPTISKLSQGSEANPTTSIEINSARIRKPSSRINTEDFVTGSTRTRSNLKATLAESKSILSNSLVGGPIEKMKIKSDCLNVSSTSPKRSKRISYSGLDFVDYDPLVTNDVSVYF